MAEKLITIGELELLFSKQVNISGYCPLPDPRSDGERAIEHVQQMRIQVQPEDYDYDIDDNTAEAQEFLNRLKALLGSGEITPREFKLLRKQFPNS